MKSAIVLNPNMGTAVVNHLRQFAELPPDGILAGQAVDSAITDLFGKGGGVYNDIDIFRREEMPFANRTRRSANALTKRFELNATPTGAYGNMNVLLEAVQTYGINSVSRHGMLNTVNCDVAWPLTSLSAERVIGGFDINCTRVAVDLATNQLVWDRNYEDFLHSRQLRVTMMHTPWHTFLRLAKKAEELPDVFVDYDVAAEACVAVARSDWLDMMLRMKGVSMAFGQKHQELAERLKSVWNPYFDFEKKRLYLGSDNRWSPDVEHGQPDGKTVELCRLVPRGELDTRMQDRCNRMGSGILFFAPRVIEASRRKVAAAAYHKLNAIVAQQPKDDVTGLPLPPAFDRSNALSFVEIHAELFGTDYVQGQALPTMAAKVSEWVRQHRGLARCLLGLTLAEQYARMNAITDVCRKFGKKYFDGDSKAGFGVLENHRDTLALSSAEAMENILTQYHLANTAPFDVNPLPLPLVVPKRFAGFQVRELLTAHELRQEGSNMGHCVGGYSDAVRRGDSRILTIRYRDERKSKHCSTVELRGEFDVAAPRLTVAQNYSVSNTAPSEQNREFLEYVIGHLRLADVLARCEGRSAQEVRRVLLQEARKRESHAKHLSWRVRAFNQASAALSAALHSRSLAERAAGRSTLASYRNAATLYDAARADAQLLRELAEVGQPVPVRAPRAKLVAPLPPGAYADLLAYEDEPIF
jgi:hypothetical protein